MYCAHTTLTERLNSTFQNVGFAWVLLAQGKQVLLLTQVTESALESTGFSWQSAEDRKGEGEKGQCVGFILLESNILKRGWG